MAGRRVTSVWGPLPCQDQRRGQLPARCQTGEVGPRRPDQRLKGSSRCVVY